jgi:hypothetical protein
MRNAPLALEMRVWTNPCIGVHESNGRLPAKLRPDAPLTYGGTGAGLPQIDYGLALPPGGGEREMRVAQTTRRSRAAAGALLVLALILVATALPAALARPPAAGGGKGGGVPPPQPYTGPPIDTANSDRCDFLDPAVCLQPWPNDYFTVADPTTDTGRRLNLNLLSMPRNAAGKPIDPAEQNLNDGFSPGNSIIVRVPGLDSPEAFENTGAVPITDIGAYAEGDQPVVVINADTGRRQPIWSEIDYNPIDPATGGDAGDPADRAKVNLIIRPAVNLDEGGRYIVALRRLRDAQDKTIRAPDAFRVYRDNLITAQPEVEARRPGMEQLFASLRQAGIKRSDLYLAWDFTVASERNLSERALAIRDDAFAKLGDTNLADLQVQGGAPSFSVDPGGVTDFAPCGTDGCQSGEDDRIARQVTGHFVVPCYLDGPGCPPGSRFLFAPGSSLPTAVPGNQTVANFQCEIPRSAIDPPAANPARPSLYGHGLLGSASEVSGGNIKSMANEHNFVFCATDWAGFSTSDLGTVLLSLQDLSLFPALADRMQQGFVNQLYLGRLLIHSQGLSSDPAFQDGGQALIDTRRLFYDGNSQGGIMGGALTALGVDFDRAVLGVPGMNYSTLLTRSVDFEPYAEGKFTPEICGALPEPLKTVCGAAPEDTPLGLYDNYPNQLERPLIFSLIQLVWDRGEANGYAHHLTGDPLPNTPAHSVLMHAAFGDHQVANVTAEVEARTIGASVYEPALDPGRYWAPGGIFGIPTIPSFPSGGSALVYWDGGPLGFPGGTATPPNENIPPRPPEFGSDPHSYPRNDVKARAQKSDFLQIVGALNNYCTTANRPDPAPEALVPNTGTPIPCHSHGWLGP